MNETGSLKWEYGTDVFEDHRSITEFRWKIKGFSALHQQVDTFYESQSFAFLGRSWCLRFFPNGEDCHSSEGWLGLYLTMSSRLSCTVDFVLGIEKVDGTKEFMKNLSDVKFDKFSAKGWRQFLQKDKLIGRESEFLPSDTLTIWIRLKCKTFEFGKSSGTIETVGPKKKDFEPQGSPTLSDSEEELLSDKEDCDASTNAKSEILNDYKLLASQDPPKAFTGDVAEEE